MRLRLLHRLHGEQLGSVNDLVLVVLVRIVECELSAWTLTRTISAQVFLLLVLY